MAKICVFWTAHMSKMIFPLTFVTCLSKCFAFLWLVDRTTTTTRFFLFWLFLQRLISWWQFWFFGMQFTAAASKLLRDSIWVLLISAARTVFKATSRVSSLLRKSCSLTLWLSIPHTILSFIRISLSVPNSQDLAFVRRSVTKASIGRPFCVHKKKS